MLSSRIIGWTVAVLTAIVFAFEATVRIDDWAQFGVPLNSPYTSLGELVVHDSLGTHARPSSQFRQFSVNSLGFRGPEVTQEELRSSTRVVVSGASESFGLYEQQGKEWPRQLEDSLEQICGDSVVVLNAAFAGMSLPTVAQDIQLRLRTIQPRVLAYYPTPMQYMEDELPVARAPNADTGKQVGRWQWRGVPRLRDAVKRSVPDVVLNELRIRDTKRMRNTLESDALSEVPAERLDAFDLDLRRLVGQLRQSGITPVLVVHRNRFVDTSSVEEQRMLRAWERFYPRFSAGAILSFDKAAALRTETVGRDSAVVVVDPLPALRPLGAEAFADFSHFTDLGAAAVGGLVARHIGGLVCGSSR